MVIRPSESETFAFQCEYKEAKTKEKNYRGRKEVLGEIQISQMQQWWMDRLSIDLMVKRSAM